jgi:hypothetical protein
MKIVFRTETIRQVEYCCKDMEKAEDGKAIVFPTDISLKYGWIFGPHNSHLGGAGRPFEIHYCPFCGIPIRFEEEIKA